MWKFSKFLERNGIGIMKPSDFYASTKLVLKNWKKVSSSLGFGEASVRTTSLIFIQTMYMMTYYLTLPFMLLNVACEVNIYK